MRVGKWLFENARTGGSRGIHKVWDEGLPGNSTAQLQDIVWIQ